MILGALPRDSISLSDDKISESLLPQAIKKSNLNGKSANEESYMLKNYYKFIMYRDPVERLVSAYRNKVGKPMIGLEDDYPNYNWAKKDVYKYKHPVKYRIWMENNGRTPVRIIFPDFVDFWLNSTQRMSHDPHFITIFDVCHPCHVHFNYYGNFKTFENDANVLIKAIRANSSHLQGSQYEDDMTNRTSIKAPDYYSQLNTEQKKKIVNKLALDLSFYYSIFPTEKDSYKGTMGFDYDIPEILPNN